MVGHTFDLSEMRLSRDLTDFNFKATLKKRYVTYTQPLSKI